MIRRIVLGGGAVVVLLVGITGCGKPEPPPPPLRPVYTFKVGEPSAEVTRSFSGLVASTSGTSVAFEVSGRVIEVMADAGQNYAGGEVLARLDATEYQNQLAGAQAQWTEAQQGLRRTQQLFETGNASKGALETAISQERAARTNFNSARKRTEDAVLKMPYDGAIGVVMVEAGEVVNAGQPVFTIQGEGGMEMEAGVPAEIIAAVRVGQEAIVYIGSLDGASFPARVKTVSPVPGSNTTYPVEFEFLARDPRVREGMDGEARLRLPHPEGATIRIPAVCVASGPGGLRYVWRFEAGEGATGRVSRRDITTGELREGHMIEVTSGLEPGELVVSRGVSRLEPGQEVRLHDPKKTSL